MKTSIHQDFSRIYLLRKIQFSSGTVSHVITREWNYCGKCGVNAEKLTCNNQMMLNISGIMTVMNVLRNSEHVLIERHVLMFQRRFWDVKCGRRKQSKQMENIQCGVNTCQHSHQIQWDPSLYQRVSAVSSGVKIGKSPGLDLKRLSLDVLGGDLFTDRLWVEGGSMLEGESMLEGGSML